MNIYKSIFFQFNILLFVTHLLGVDYEADIQPIFDHNCTVYCHSGGDPSGGLNLTDYDNLMTGGENGAVIIPGDHISSLLWIRVDNGTMPPGNNPDLSQEQINLIADWIDEGANCGQDCLNINDSNSKYSFSLDNTFPNPFNPRTTISYSIYEASSVKISVFNTNGHLVDNILNQSHQPGTYQVHWNGGALVSGIYFVTLDVNGLVQTKKMTLLK